MKPQSRRMLAMLSVVCVTVATPVADAAKPHKTSKSNWKPLAARKLSDVSANLLSNGSFSTSVDGWAGSGSAVSLRSGGLGGSGAAHVSLARAANTFSLQAKRDPVTSTSAGALYGATAWIRSDTSGRKLCLRVREWAGTSVAGSAQGCTTSTGSWKQAPVVSYKAVGSGNRLDTYLYEAGAVAGDSFDVDEFWFVAAAGVPTPPPPVPPTPSAPDTSITSGPAANGTATTAAFVFTATATAATFQCALDGAVWSGCASPRSLSGLGLGSHVFRVRALADGQADGTPASWSWTVATVQGVPSPVPGLTWLNPFPQTTTWNTPLPASPALDPASAAKVAYLVANAKNPNMSLHAWTTAIAVATADSPRYTVPCTMYRCSLNALGPIPIPRGSRYDAENDGHLAVWDPATNQEYDFWQPKYDAANDRWTASAGAAFSTLGDGVVPTSAGAAGNAAHIPLIAGLVRPEELAAGHIDHALMFGMPGVASGRPKCPAAANQGSSPNPAAIPEGTRVQLDPSLDVDSLNVPAWKKTVMKALQRYGMFLRDGSGTLTITGENPLNRGYDAWATLAGINTPNGSISLSGIPWNRMRVIDAPFC